MGSAAAHRQLLPQEATCLPPPHAPSPPSPPTGTVTTAIAATAAIAAIDAIAAIAATVAIAATAATAARAGDGGVAVARGAAAGRWASAVKAAGRDHSGCMGVAPRGLLPG